MDKLNILVIRMSVQQDNSKVLQKGVCNVCLFTKNERKEMNKSKQFRQGRGRVREISKCGVQRRRFPQEFQCYQGRRRPPYRLHSKEKEEEKCWLYIFVWDAEILRNWSGKKLGLSITEYLTPSIARKKDNKSQSKTNGCMYENFSENTKHGLYDYFNQLH